MSPSNESYATEEDASTTVNTNDSDILRSARLDPSHSNERSRWGASLRPLRVRIGLTGGAWARRRFWFWRTWSTTTWSSCKEIVEPAQLPLVDILHLSSVKVIEVGVPRIDVTDGSLVRLRKSSFVYAREVGHLPRIEVIVSFV